jgi:hypothetical protein
MSSLIDKSVMDGGVTTKNHWLALVATLPGFGAVIADISGKDVGIHYPPPNFT